MCVIINLGQIEMEESTRGFTAIGEPDGYGQQQLCCTGVIIWSQLVQPAQGIMMWKKSNWKIEPAKMSGIIFRSLQLY